jgi:hypothetical protein
MPITGYVFLDKNANGVQDAGEPGMAGVTVTIVEAAFLNGFSGQGITDGNGFYTIDTTGMGATNFTMQVQIHDDWISTTQPNPNTGTFGPDDVWNWGMAPRCVRTPQSSWVWKVCFFQGQGVTVTFKDRTKHKGHKLFTCLYPGTTLTDYAELLAAASKGRWIHWFYDKKRAYIPWSISP